MSISAILTGVAGLSPVFDSNVTVRVWNYDNIKDSLSEASCPVRMILSPGDEVEAGFEVIGIGGGSNRATWNVLDRIYLFPVTLGRGIEAYNKHWFNYCESYLAAVEANRCLSTTNAHVIGVRCSRLYAREYPEGAEGAYWVIDVMLTIEEFI